MGNVNSKYLLSAYYLPSTTEVYSSKQDEVPILTELPTGLGKQAKQNTQMCIYLVMSASDIREEEN